MAGFRVDMTPLERSSMNIGRSLMGVGQTIADSRLRSQQQEAQQQEQGDIEAFMRQAMSGDQRALEELMIKSPQAAQQVAQYIQAQQTGQQSEQDRFTGEIAENTASFIEQMHTAPQDQQEAMFNAAIDDPRYDIDEEDRALFMDVNARKAIVGKVKGKEYAEAFFGGDGSLGDQPSAVKETEWFNKQSPEIQATHLKIKRGEKPSLDEKLDYEKSKAEIKEDSAISTARKKTQEQRRQGYIDSGVSSADNLMTVNRSIELLDEIKTGGIDNAIIRAKQAFGIESGDEAELSYELGKSVLKQLKPTFGAAFTVNEMLELKRMEAGLGKSVAGNRRILANLAKMIKRSANRGMRAAKSLGDDFAANEIMMALEGGQATQQSAGNADVPEGDQRAEQDIFSQYGIK